MGKKVLISSTGGHWTQLNEIYSKSKDKTKISLITEKNDSNKTRNDILFLKQQDRKNKEFIFTFIYNVILSLYYVMKIRPDIVVSTGAGSVLPFLIFSKLFGARVVFIESFAKIHTPTITGRIVYKFADHFYVQWPTMLEKYPKAEYKGSLY
ncbi:PssD/Cps14F family polysaccharide biosynthesis glycosyltransferase [Sporosarcina sp. E16_8]|uniref:PssD/Cps14F family polysaccharide biosynthesis glycosyltransferase n=1 Tax=Sporosarcina sp. E16_8 TaxID=2789295 RepID=UPI001A92C3A3|nr:PssD/Cps14F family polysaccharide biosynthesis glycosyltransferase [Sporosarcina sp. E16_8]MBO0589173.1 polysaccharide biosynthesis protein [Sporosarcina sp. E16_8]